MNNKLKGFITGAVAAATYGMNPLFTLPLYQQGMKADSVLFYRYLLALVILGGLMKWQKIPFKIKPNEIIPSVAIGLLVAISSLTLFLAYNYMDAGIASTLLFIYPVMVAVIMGVFFHEKITAITVSSIILALGGIGMLYKGGDGKTLNLIGVWLVMASALSYSFYIVIVNRSVLNLMNTTKLTFYALLFGLVIYVVRLKFGAELQWIPSWNGLANVLMLALLPTVLSFICTAKAIHYLGSTPTAILGALEPVTAVFFGVAVFGETLTLRLIAGIILIIAAVSMILSGNYLSGKAKHLKSHFARKQNQP